ncbi:MAG: outer membrane protein transport protein, partial [Myxococcota bacterium]
MILAWVAAGAMASSLDLIEVGGAFGTPASTNATAVWWNPAGLAVHGGSSALVEVAPTVGRLRIDRDNPDYGAIDTAVLPEGFPTAVDYGGTDRIDVVGLIPFVGVQTDAGIDGLGLGAAVYVPFARAGGLDNPEGPNRYMVRDGTIQAVYTSLAAAYQIADRVSVGVSGSLVSNRYRVDTDTSFYADLLD